MAATKKQRVKKVTLIPPGQKEEYTQAKMVEDAIKHYNRKGPSYVAVYGIDEQTASFLRGVWQNPNITRFGVCDPDPINLQPLNLEMMAKPFSMNRWMPTVARGFIMEGYWPTIIVTEELYHTVRLMKNKPKGTKIRTIEQLAKGMAL